MKAVYYLPMDLDTANVVGYYDTREDAFATVLEAFERHGLAGVEDLGLSLETEDGGGELLGIGVDLLHLAQAPSVSRIAG